MNTWTWFGAFSFITILNFIAWHQSIRLFKEMSRVTDEWIDRLERLTK